MCWVLEARKKQEIRRLGRYGYIDSFGGGGEESFPVPLQVWKGIRCLVAIGGEWVPPKGWQDTQEPTEMEMSVEIPACEQQDKANALCSQDDLIRLLLS